MASTLSNASCFYRDIQKATQNFTTILGEGSFGPVYKAKMATGEVVAVKVLASYSTQGEKEFQTEVSATRSATSVVGTRKLYEQSFVCYKISTDLVIWE